MPRCDCGEYFTPKERPKGCPFCKPTAYPYPVCKACGPIREMVEAGPHGEVIRLNCPTCGWGPLVPSGLELLRRKILDPKVKAVAAEAPQAVEPPKPPREGEQVCEILVSRKDGPITIYVKSPLVEDFISKLALSQQAASIKSSGSKAIPTKPAMSGVGPEGTPWAGKRGYHVSMPASASGSYPIGGFGRYNGLPGVELQDYSILLTEGLKDGVTFTYATVCAKEMLHACQERIRGAIMELYVQYMLPAEYSAEVVTKESARE